MRFYLVPLLLLSSLFMWAQINSSPLLIPQPKLIQQQLGFYNLNRDFHINYSGSDTFSAQQLLGLFYQRASIQEQTLSEKPQVNLVTADSSALTLLLNEKHIDLPFALGNEGYVLQITPNNILIAAQSNAGVFYGTQTLTQLLNGNYKDSMLPCFTIYDRPDMQMRGWQDDISRGPIPTLDFLKKEIRRMAGYKLNTFTLYTEHVFKLKKHPTIAPADGISEEEIKELTAYAKNYHVEIIGNFQSFGHFSNILKVPGYENLAENPQTLSPAKEEAYRFLNDAYSEVAPAYTGNYFHINCDEVALGGGACKSMIDSIGMDGVYAYHINRIDSLLKPYHKRIMMWGDIAVHNPNIINRLPKDMIIVSWDYGPLESMDDKIVPFVNSGFDFIVAPGVSCWSRIYPDMQRATINIYSYLRDGYKHKAIGFINTTWDDSGQNLFGNNWYSLTWGADCGWNAPLDEELKQSKVTREQRVAAFNRAYNRIYFGTDKQVIEVLLKISDLRNGAVKNCLSDAALWSPLLPDYNLIDSGYERENLLLIKRIDSLNKEVAKLRPYYGHNTAEYELLPLALRQARLVANKNLLGIRLRKYIATDKNRDISYFAKDFKELSDSIHAIKPAYAELWKTENRNWWLDSVLANYDAFAQNLQNLKGVCIIKASDTLVNGMREIRLRSAFNNLPVYYTIDGTTPSPASQLYTHPIYADSNLGIKARVIENGRMYEIQSDSFVFHKGIGKLHKLNSAWNTEHNIAYAARGKFALADGRRGSPNNFSDGVWQGYWGNDIDIELDLGQPTQVSRLSMRFGQLMRYGILYPRQIEVSISNDGINYQPIETIANSIDPNTEERSIHNFVAALGVSTRYIKVVARNPGLLPEWHYAKGNKSWLFADEIVVE